MGEPVFNGTQVAALYESIERLIEALKAIGADSSLSTEDGCAMRIFVERYTIAALMGTEYDDGSAPVSGELADKVARDLKSGLAVIEREYGAALGRTTDADLRDVLSVDYARLGLVALGEVLEDRP